jgi:alkylation response protein AidB-like acyl-CoA dehydrogenase
MAHIQSMARSMPNPDGGSYADDPGFKTRFDAVSVQILSMEFTELRILSQLANGQNVGPESSMLKTRGTELQQAATELAMEVAGTYMLAKDDSTPLDDDPFVPVSPRGLNGVTQDYFNTRKVSIYAGSNEIQRNIMAKLVLGL